MMSFVLLLAGGCVRRELTITSNPPGALVHLNGQEFGRTPVTRPFTWYGGYDVTLRREGYETLKTRGDVIAPWWQWPPIDLLAEALPLTDRQSLHYDLEPRSPQSTDPQRLLDRANELRQTLPTTASTAPAGAVSAE